VIRGLGIDRHPELEAMYFANYRRLVLPLPGRGPGAAALARAAAARLNLAFEHRHVGLGELATSIAAFAAGAPIHVQPLVESLGETERRPAGTELVAFGLEGASA
jgi:hypothetical protein